MTDDELDLIDAALKLQSVNFQEKQEWQDFKTSLIKVAVSRVPAETKLKFLAYQQARLSLPSATEFGCDLYNALMDEAEAVFAK